MPSGKNHLLNNLYMMIQQALSTKLYSLHSVVKTETSSCWYTTENFYNVINEKLKEKWMKMKNMGPQQFGVAYMHTS
jgi:hypothetical protein